MRPRKGVAQSELGSARNTDWEVTDLDLNSYSQVGAWIRNARGDLGLNQRELGKAIGRSRTVVTNWEGNQFMPGADSCAVLAEFFGVPVDEVVGLVRRSRSRQRIVKAPRGGYGAYPLKVLVAEPMIEKPRGGCKKCEHKMECRKAVARFLPLLCEVWDVHDLYVAEMAGMIDVVRERMAARRA